MYDGDKEALIKQCNNMRSGDEDELWDLVAQGINIDVRDEWGNTALIHAALNGSLEPVQELIRAGAALDVQKNNDYADKGCNGYTALACAAMNGHLEAVQELIRAGAALDVRVYPFPRSPGMTALELAQEADNAEIAAMLREAGARCDKGYKRSGVFNSTCKWCGGKRLGHGKQRRVG